MRLSNGHRRWIYWSGAALFATGALWLLFHYFLRRHGPFGETGHPLEVWWLRLHGACAMLVLVVLGSLLPIHVRRGWHQRRNLLAGCMVSAIALLLIVSGYGLYYYGGEDGRPWISAFHWLLGLGTPALLVWHIWSGRHSVDRLHSPAKPDAVQYATDPSRARRSEAQAPGQPSRPSISA
jgi:hypothetical protein